VVWTIDRPRSAIISTRVALVQIVRPPISGPSDELKAARWRGF
jgi:hypothetical protein